MAREIVAVISVTSKLVDFAFPETWYLRPETYLRSDQRLENLESIYAA
jgi:hypothetical protein